MKQQDYNNHKKYYAPHHFIFLPAMSICTIAGVANALKADVHGLEWWLFSVLSFSILYLAIMLRQHYALGNQNRIVRLEFRLRYFERLGHSAKNAEEQLSFSQIAALRFCDDSTFAELVKKAIAQKLSSNDIKKQIKQWQPDYMRV